MRFPQSDSVPYLQLDGRDGSFKYGEGQDKEVIDLEGKNVAMDLGGAEQGWLQVGAGGADWKALTKTDEWGDSPGPDYKPGVAVMVYGKCFGDPEKGYRFRGNSNAHNRFVQAIHQEVADGLGNGKMPLIKIGKAKVISVGAGSSVEVAFKVAPASNWPDAPSGASAGAEDSSSEAGSDDEWS